MEQKVDIRQDKEPLDVASAKANRPIEPLREVQQNVDSLSEADIQYVRELATEKCKSAF